RVAIVVGIAPVSRIPTISGPETVDRSHGLQDVTGFVPDHETRIDDLNVMVWADRAVRVWRVSPGRERLRAAVADARERDERGGHRREDSGQRDRWQFAVKCLSDERHSVLSRE